ncbi:hypothetical protein IF2G_01460 [Cordyceps javanica]|nr:hypothetical protein IF2G_01460 [Cordyceps javanica]
MASTPSVLKDGAFRGGGRGMEGGQVMGKPGRVRVASVATRKSEAVDGHCNPEGLCPCQL